MIYIIGAGPAGCACAYYLSKAGYKSKVFEASKYIGGMSRTIKISNEIHIDCGPHIFHSPDQEITNDWKEISKENLKEKSFYSYVVKGKNYDKFISYPISEEELSKNKEFLNYQFQLNKDSSSAKANNYKEYMISKVGEELEKAFFRKYPEKLWGIPTSQMRADWAPKRIQIRKQIKPFFDGQFCSSHIMGAGLFYEELKGSSVNSTFYFKEPVIKFNFKDNQIKSFNTLNQKIELKEDDLIISTIPITKLGELLSIESNLKYRGVCVINVITKNVINLPKDAAWLYFDQPEFPFTRITNHTIISPNSIESKNRTILTFEIPFSINDEIHKSDDNSLFKKIEKSIKILNYWPNETFSLISVIKEPFVYPVREFNYEKELLKYKTVIDNYPNLFSLGSSGEFVYGDSQITFRKCKDFLSDLISDIKNNSFLVKKVRSYSIKKESISEWSKFINKGENYRPVLISEAGLNHNGNLELAKKLIEESFKAGADAIKFQLFESRVRASKNDRDAFYSEQADGEGENLSQLFERTELSIEELKHLKVYSDKVGIPMFVSAFDIENLIKASKIFPECIKISSMDLTNFEIWSKAPKLFKTIIASTGMSTIQEIRRSVELFEKIKLPETNLALLHCVSSYPLSINDSALGTINSLKELTNIVGYSDHSLDITTPFAAAVLGAKVIEKHFTLDRSLEGPDHIHSLDPQSLKELTSLLKNIPKILSSRKSTILPCESQEARRQKKGCYATKNIESGSTFKKEDFEIKAPCLGLDSFEIYSKINQQLSQDIKKGQFIKDEHF